METCCLGSVIGVMMMCGMLLSQVLKPVIEGMLEDLEQQQRLLEEQDKSEQLLRSYKTLQTLPARHACLRHNGQLVAQLTHDVLCLHAGANRRSLPRTTSR